MAPKNPKSQARKKGINKRKRDKKFWDRAAKCARKAAETEVELIAGPVVAGNTEEIGIGKTDVSEVIAPDSVWRAVMECGEKDKPENVQFSQDVDDRSVDNEEGGDDNEEEEEVQDQTLKTNNLMKKQDGVFQVFNCLKKTKEHGKTINQESFDHVSANVQQMITSVFSSESAQQYAKRMNEETDQEKNNVVDVDEEMDVGEEEDVGEEAEDRAEGEVDDEMELHKQGKLKYFFLWRVITWRRSLC